MNGRRVSQRAFCALAFAAMSAMAHHAGAPFDRAHAILATGTVKSFTWTNPHAWLYLTVPNGNGQGDEWQLEGPSVSVMVRNGWNVRSLQSGQKVKALVAPRRDGTKGGELLSVTFDDGKVLSFGIL
jgi:hypothetical protein